MMLTPREMEKFWSCVLADLARKRRDRGAKQTALANATSGGFMQPAIRNDERVPR